MSRSLTKRIFFLSVAFLPATLTWAFNVSPSADTFVSSANPAGNYGGAGAFGASASGLPKGEFQSLLRFDLAAAKTSFDGLYGVGGWALSSASLQMTPAAPNNAIFNTSAAGQIAASWMVNDSWIEGNGTPMGPSATGVNWNTLSSFLSPGDQSLGSLSFSGATTGPSVLYPLTVSHGLNNDATAGSLASIRLLAGSASVSGLFNSRSNSTPANRPVLILDAITVPEPTSCLLAAFGILGVTAISRRTVPFRVRGQN